jgi:hypothetical protein
VLGGGQEHLDVGVGPHDGADVATLDHDAAHPDQRALQPDQQLADRRDGRHGRYGGVHLGRAERGPGLGPVEQYPRRPGGPGRELEGQVDGLGRVGDRHGVIDRDPPPQQGEREGPVGGPGVQIAEPGPLGDPPGDGALPRPGRPVDGDDHVAASLDGLVPAQPDHPHLASYPTMVPATVRRDPTAGPAPGLAAPTVVPTEAQSTRWPGGRRCASPTGRSNTSVNRLSDLLTW